jgi:hypothetical protein
MFAATGLGLGNVRRPLTARKSPQADATNTALSQDCGASIWLTLI